MTPPNVWKMELLTTTAVRPKVPLPVKMVISKNGLGCAFQLSLTNTIVLLLRNQPPRTTTTPQCVEKVENTTTIAAPSKVPNHALIIIYCSKRIMFAGKVQMLQLIATSAELVLTRKITTNLNVLKMEGLILIAAPRKALQNARMALI